MKNGRRNIVFLLPAMTAGGAERVMITLMNSLPRDQYNPSMISVSSEGPMASLIDNHIEHISLERTIKTGIPSLYKALKKQKPEIVISTMAPMNFASLLLQPLFRNTKFIVREAITPSFFLEQKPRIAGLIRLSYKILYKRADKILAPAAMILDELHELGLPREKMMCLPNPVDVEKIRNASHSLPSRKDKNTVHFIAAGRLHPQKNYAALISSLGKLQKDSWHLTILGEGEERELLENIIRENNFKDKVSLSGHTSDPWPLIAGCDAFLLPSLYEGLPNVALESLACGTKVIAMKSAGGIHEIATHCDTNDIQICENMDDFISKMRSVSPKPVTQYRASKLPDFYMKNNITRRFASILESLG